MSFYIGLSLLSNMFCQEEPHREGRRILSSLKGRSIAENEFQIGENGRPFLNEPCDFSISHSGAMAAVSLVNGENLRTGCDIQIARPMKNAREIAETFFSAAECGYTCAGGHFDKNRFFEIWTLKECFLKLRGLSVFDMASTPSFIGSDKKSRERFIFNEAVSIPVTFFLYGLAGNTGGIYYLAAAAEGRDQAEPEIRWLSESFLPCKRIAKIKAAASPARTVNPKM